MDYLFGVAILLGVMGSFVGWILLFSILSGFLVGGNIYMLMAVCIATYRNSLHLFDVLEVMNKPIHVFCASMVGSIGAFISLYYPITICGGIIIVLQIIFGILVAAKTS